MDAYIITLLIVTTSIGAIFLSVKDKRFKIAGLLILIITFSYVCSTRPIESADTETYLWYYKNSANITSFKYGLGRDYYPWVENWYINLNWFCNKILNLDFRQFLFACSFVFNSISLYSLLRIIKIRYGDIKKSVFLISIIFLFFANFGFLYSYVVIRGGLSFAFCLLAYLFFLKKKYIITCFYMLLSILLHNYSIVFIPIMILSQKEYKKNHKQLFLVLFILLLAMSLFRFDVIFTNSINQISGLFTKDLIELTHYLLDAQDTNAIRKGAVLYLIQNVYLSILLYRDKENHTRDFIVLLAGGIITALINDDGAIRITNYFYLFQIFLYSKYLLAPVTKTSKGFMANALIITIVIPLATLVFILRYCSIL